MSQKQKPSLLVDFCSYEAAKWAVEHWHYSGAMPAGKTVKFGVWEGGEFVGTVIFSRGANNMISRPYNLKQDEVCELTRVALTRHKVTVSKIISECVNRLKKNSDGLRLIVSYADTNQNHHGGIYQASNWVYVGEIELDACILFGKPIHRRTIFSRYKTNSIEWLKANVDKNARWADGKGKHKYLYPLDKAMRRQIEPLAKPYPKRAGVGEMESRKVSSLET